MIFITNFQYDFCFKFGGIHEKRKKNLKTKTFYEFAGIIAWYKFNNIHQKQIRKTVDRTNLGCLKEIRLDILV